MNIVYYEEKYSGDNNPKGFWFMVRPPVLTRRYWDVDKYDFVLGDIAHFFIQILIQP